MEVNDESTWPPELLARIESERATFLAYERRRASSTAETPFDFPRWEQLNRALSDFVASYSLRAFHCTRLTGHEIAEILESGMVLPNEGFLRRRIGVLENSGAVTSDISRRLLEKNAARHPDRKDRIWFCFYPPRLSEQDGIERFFRCWGGEALYNYHETDPITGTVLNSIGTPCIIEAEVPIQSVGRRNRLIELLGRQYLVNRGLRTSEEMQYDDYVVQPLAASCVIRVLRYADSDFTVLTDCASWNPPLRP